MLCGLLRLRPLLPRRLLRDLVPPFVHALGLPGPLVLWRICEQRTRPQSCALADVSRRLQERTNTTCDGLPAYQQQRGGLALYQIDHHGGSVWYVGEGERLGDCDTRFRYMWSDMASARQVPDHQSYSGWKRCAPQTCLSHILWLTCGQTVQARPTASAGGVSLSSLWPLPSPRDPTKDVALGQPLCCPHI